MREDELDIPGVPISSLTERDKQILSSTDEKHRLHTWDELKTIISSNSLEKLTRLPSQLRAYLIWNVEQKKAYGNITNFLLKNRLHWVPLPGSSETGAPTFTPKTGVPFADRSDYRILINDWPYGLEPGIKHVCVWLKVRLPVDDVDGDLTPEGKKMVVDFVGKTFVEGLGVQGQDRVLWFKNWARLQSVRGLEHIHVLLRAVDGQKLDGILEQPEEMVIPT